MNRAYKASSTHIEEGKVDGNHKLCSVVDSTRRYRTFYTTIKSLKSKGEYRNRSWNQEIIPERLLELHP